MIYQIKLYYTTGDSYQTYDTSDILDMHWENLNVVTENLNRIKEHNDYLRNLKSYFKQKDLVKPAWFKVNDKFGESYSVNLLTDDRKEFTIFTFWIGYFQHLQYGEVIISLPSIKF